ncbi:MAG: ATP-dependent nuclease [Candidatus Calescibacterium sp.]
MIKKIKIQNFRSIRNLEIQLGKINAFIGPNNAGKSNIMKALNLILGETYPTIKSFDDKDFYRYSKDNPIIIQVSFDQPLNCDNRIYGFKLTYNGDDCEYVAIDQDENELTYSTGAVVKVSKEMKDEVALMYLSIERLASKQVSSSQWTLYGKLLKHLNAQIGQQEKEKFKKLLENVYEKTLYQVVEHFENTLRSYIQNQTGLDILLKLSPIDPIEVFKNLRPYFKEGDIEYDAEDMGAGTQSALAIAIARAYAEIVRKPVIIAIEEPELYLHPHGCRHFYKLLKELANSGLQVIYTTHERSFIDISDFESIHIVKKEGDETKVFSGISLSMPSQFDEVKLASKFDQYINEVFFADKVVLVEGFSDKIACQLALEKLGIDIDLKNISIIECGGKTAIEPIARILKHFNIKTYALLDADAEEEISKLQQLLGEDKVLVQKPDLEGMLGRDRLGLNPNEKLKKEKSLELLPSYFQNIQNNELPEIYRDLEHKLRSNV